MAVKVWYSDVPFYCNACKKLGHDDLHYSASVLPFVVPPMLMRNEEVIPHYLPIPPPSVLGKPPLPSHSPIMRGGKSTRGFRGGRGFNLNNSTGRFGMGGRGSNHPNHSYNRVAQNRSSSPSISPPFSHPAELLVDATENLSHLPPPLIITSTYSNSFSPLLELNEIAEHDSTFNETSLDETGSKALSIDLAGASDPSFVSVSVDDPPLSVDESSPASDQSFSFGTGGSLLQDLSVPSFEPVDKSFFRSKSEGELGDLSDFSTETENICVGENNDIEDPHFDSLLAETELVPSPPSFAKRKNSIIPSNPSKYVISTPSQPRSTRNSAKSLSTSGSTIFTRKKKVVGKTSIPLSQ